ncbi:MULTISPECIES: HlyD family secretion protein [Novosphingobium]|jgi:membrane fusion protein (multidrug efflux system)|uniref:Membrane fusion protein, multidrug efflux system n=1 Tax=Novosphingobium panipatense TaxID=428991 RepID=A0ABY1QHD6_9SPHN|nr:MULTISPECIES: HlyD family secretion protein [Novosphingobium]SMP71580.1 membrane fusion protein, multidrug efflux system [Novosphingobium panipatense]
MADERTPPQPDDEPRDEAANEGSRRPGLSRRTKGILLIAAAVVLLAVAIWVVRYKTYGQYFEETDDAQIRADAVTIAPKVSGYVTAVLVGDDQDVVAGQQLVWIDPGNYDAQVAQARAQIAQASAGAENARAAISEQEAAIEQAEAQLEAARDKAAHDAAEVARYAPLAASGAETRQQLAQLRLAADQSAQQVRQQAAALEMQRRRVSGMRAQVRQAEAQGEGARAQLQAAGIDLSSTRMASPTDGRIGDRTVRVGQFVQAGTRLMTVVPLDKLYVVANFKETQLARMRPGQPAKIAVDALEGTEIRGRVISVSPGTGAQFSILPPQNATGNFTKIVQRVPVRLAIEAPASARKVLVPGLSVRVTVDTRGGKGEIDRIQKDQEQLENKAN